MHFHGVFLGSQHAIWPKRHNGKVSDVVFALSNLVFWPVDAYDRNVEVMLTPELEAIVRHHMLHGAYRSPQSVLTKTLDALKEAEAMEHAVEKKTQEIPAASHANGAAPSDIPIWEVFAATDDIPDEEWEKLPTDLSTQHDHYLYGTPKRQI
jgi:hypothetical protein